MKGVATGTEQTMRTVLVSRAMVETRWQAFARPGEHFIWYNVPREP